ncbi:hypothetical protein EG327_007267 [Venturia inaequalis]|uniref:Uncharacterized protein n=1 Tax=Venturia inaequalis TaxID=5025 RepID=A0A8H3YYS4_VENIN|nr:hypothetical protein EG327_007267 [Venturia inaequalis]
MLKQFQDLEEEPNRDRNVKLNYSGQLAVKSSGETLKSPWKLAASERAQLTAFEQLAGNSSFDAVAAAPHFKIDTVSADYGGPSEPLVTDQNSFAAVCGVARTVPRAAPRTSKKKHSDQNVKFRNS